MVNHANASQLPQVLLHTSCDRKKFLCLKSSPEELCSVDRDTKSGRLMCSAGNSHGRLNNEKYCENSITERGVVFCGCSLRQYLFTIEIPSPQDRIVDLNGAHVVSFRD